MNEIKEIVNEFKANSKPVDRYTSFDYCYYYLLIIFKDFFKYKYEFKPNSNQFSTGLWEKFSLLSVIEEYI